MQRNYLDDSLDWGEFLFNRNIRFELQSIIFYFKLKLWIGIVIVYTLYWLNENEWNICMYIVYGTDSYYDCLLFSSDFCQMFLFNFSFFFLLSIIVSLFPAQNYSTLNTLTTAAVFVRHGSRKCRYRFVNNTPFISTIWCCTKETTIRTPIINNKRMNTNGKCETECCWYYRGYLI